MFDVLNEEFLLFYMFFSVYHTEERDKFDSLMASPLVLNFCTTRTVSGTLIIG